MKSALIPLVFAVGIVVAITGGAKAPTAVGGWPDTWPVFLVGFLVALAALVVWRIQRAQARAHAAKTEATSADADPFALLAGMQAPLSQLGNELKGLEGKAICAKLEAFNEQWILPLALVRQRVIDRMGMTKGAEVLVNAAYGERMLNRAWSAAADNYLDEAHASVPPAVEALQVAARLAAA